MPRFYPKPRFCGGDCVRVGQGNGREKPNSKVSKVPMAIQDRDFGLTGQDREARFATDQGGFESCAPNDCYRRKGASALRLDVVYRLNVLI
jgi:hypothetical protein